MKKILGIFFVILLSSNAFAEKYSISCEGTMNLKKVLPWETNFETASFYEDYEIRILESKKIDSAKITNASHWHLRQGMYLNKQSKSFGLLKQSNDGMVLMLTESDKPDNEVAATTTNIKTRLSLNNGSSTGSYTYKMIISGVTVYYYYRYKAKCSGTRELIAALNEEIPSGPKIDDNEIIAASSGSGFFVSKEGHIVTNFHVIENCKIAKVHYKGKEIEAEIFAVDKTNDLAILQTNINPFKIFPVSNKDVTLLQDVIVAGYPLGKNVSSAIKIHPGSVTALAGFGDNYSNFQTDATINQGNSGGPIIDKYGNVVGIAVATWVEEGVQGIHFGIKSSVLITFANAKELNFSVSNYRKISKEKLGKLISEATTYLECWMTGAKIKKMIAEADSKKAFFSKFKQ